MICLQEFRYENPSAIGHAIILSSPSREEALSAARRIATAAVCLRGHDVPCGVCRGCRKAVAGTHPDIIPVRRLTDKSGNARRELTVAQIRELSLDAQVLPGEAERKVYIVEEAELLNLNAQNAALKLLEEPPRTVLFLLCVCNPDLLLETVRSRCTIVSLAGDSDGIDNGSRELAVSFFQAACSGNPEMVYQWIAQNELSKLDAASAFLDAAIERCSEILCRRTPAGNLTAEQLMQIYRLLQRCSDYMKVNVNAKHIFSLLTAETIRIGDQV